MNLNDRLLKIDTQLAAAHRALNHIAMGHAVDLSIVHDAIAELTQAREQLNDLATAQDVN